MIKVRGLGDVFKEGFAEVDLSADSRTGTAGCGRNGGYDYDIECRRSRGIRRILRPFVKGEGLGVG